jgi:hypothetical protein
MAEIKTSDRPLDVASMAMHRCGFRVYVVVVPETASQSRAWRFSRSCSFLVPVSRLLSTRAPISCLDCIQPTLCFFIWFCLDYYTQLTCSPFIFVKSVTCSIAACFMPCIADDKWNCGSHLCHASSSACQVPTQQRRMVGVPHVALYIVFLLKKPPTSNLV